MRHLVGQSGALLTLLVGIGIHADSSAVTVDVYRGPEDIATFGGSEIDDGLVASIAPEADGWSYCLDIDPDTLEESVLSGCVVIELPSMAEVVGDDQEGSIVLTDEVCDAGEDCYNGYVLQEAHVLQSQDLYDESFYELRSIYIRVTPEGVISASGNRVEGTLVHVLDAELFGTWGTWGMTGTARLSDVEGTVLYENTSGFVLDGNDCDGLEEAITSHYEALRKQAAVGEKVLLGVGATLFGATVSGVLILVTGGVAAPVVAAGVAAGGGVFTIGLQIIGASIDADMSRVEARAGDLRRACEEGATIVVDGIGIFSGGDGGSGGGAGGGGGGGGIVIVGIDGSSSSEFCPPDMTVMHDDGSCSVHDCHRAGPDEHGYTDDGRQIVEGMCICNPDGVEYPAGDEHCDGESGIVEPEGDGYMP